MSVQESTGAFAFSPSRITIRVSRKSLSLSDALALPDRMTHPDSKQVAAALRVPGLGDVLSGAKVPWVITRAFDLDHEFLIRTFQSVTPNGVCTKAGLDEDPLGLARTFSLYLPIKARTEGEAVQRLRVIAGRLAQLEGIEDATLEPVRQGAGHPVGSLNPMLWHLKAIGIERAWQLTMGDPSVAVAVVGSGIDLDHEALRENLLPGVNATADPADAVGPLECELDDDYAGPDAEPRDLAGHGTSLAGIIAAAERDGNEVIGVAPRCGLVPVKCALRYRRIAADHQPHLVYGTSLEMARGIIAAAQLEGVRVINLGLGGTRPTWHEFAALRFARASGCVVTTAAGNSGMFGLLYPAAYKASRPRETDHMMVVGATTREDFIAHFSNFGDLIDVVAPGEDIYSTWSGNRYHVASGTSMASAVVAGLAALLFSQRPGATAGQVVDAIKDTAEELGRGRGDLYFGCGRIRADQAVGSF